MYIYINLGLTLLTQRFPTVVERGRREADPVETLA